MQLADQALEIFLRDVILIVLVEELHITTHNTTYWTGWATKDNPYVAPYYLWAGFLLEFLNLEPAR